MKRGVLASVAFALLLGCGRYESPQKASIPQRAAAFSEEEEVRIAIYAYYVSGSPKLFLVEESDQFVRSMRAHRGIEVFRRDGDSYGTKLSIRHLRIDDGVAHAGFLSYSGPLGTELYSVRLKKEKDGWVVTQWRLDAAS